MVLLKLSELKRGKSISHVWILMYPFDIYKEVAVDTWQYGIKLQKLYSSSMIMNGAGLRWLSALAVILVAQFFCYTADAQSSVPGCAFGVHSVAVNVYTRKYPDGIKLKAEELAKADLNIDPSKTVNFLTHGFVSSGNNSNFYDITQRLLALDDQPVFAVDWSDAACGVNVTLLDYILYGEAARNTRGVGEFLGEYVLFLVKKHGVSLSDVTLMGHSLGAHVSGFAGQHIFKTTGKKVGRIIAFDPAGPLFTTAEKDERLSDDDADRVDALHTSFLFGIQRPVGDLDIKVNGGFAQPACGLEQVCSHSFPMQMMKYSLCSGCNFIATPYVVGQLVEPLAESECTDNCFIFSLTEKTDATGVYSITTNNDPPYCHADEAVSKKCLVEP